MHKEVSPGDILIYLKDPWRVRTPSGIDTGQKEQFRPNKNFGLGDLYDLEASGRSGGGGPAPSETIRDRR